MTGDAWTLSLTLGTAYDVRLLLDASRLLSIPTLTSVALLDAWTGESLSRVTFEGAQLLDASLRNPACLAVDAAGTVAVLSLPSLRCERRLPGIGEGSRCWFTDDGRAIVRSSWDGTIRIDSLDDDAKSVTERRAGRIVVLCASVERSRYAYVLEGEDGQLVVYCCDRPFSVSAAHEVLRISRQNAFRVVRGAMTRDWLALRGHRDIALISLERGTVMWRRRVAFSGQTDDVAISPAGEIATTDMTGGRSRAHSSRCIVGIDMEMETRWSVPVRDARSIHFDATGGAMVVGSSSAGAVFRRDA